MQESNSKANWKKKYCVIDMIGEDLCCFDIISVLIVPRLSRKGILYTVIRIVLR